MTSAFGNVIATVYVRVLPAIKDFSKNLRQNIRKSQRDLRSLDRELKLVEEGFRRIGAAATGIVPGVNLARTSLLAMGGHAVVGGLLSAAGALTLMSGALLVIPAAGAAAASVMGTLAIGMRGVGDALKDFDDVEDFNEALDELSGNARKTLGVLNEFRDDINAFRESIQDKLFEGLDDVGRNLIETFMPRLEKHFGNLATQINATVKEVSAFATSAATLRDFDEITGNVETAFQNLRTAAVPVATAIRDIVTVGSRALPELANEIARGAQQFAAFIAITRATGQLQTWIDNGINAFKTFGAIMANIGRTIGGLFGAARSSGAGFLQTLEDLTDRMAEFVNSTRGQNQIKDFLVSAREAGEAVLPVFLALADLIFLHVVPALERIAKAVGPAVEEFFLGLGDALDVAGPGITAFAEGFASFIRAITPVLPLIGQLVGQIGMLVGEMATALGPAIADVASAIGNVLMPILQALTALFSIIPADILKLIVVLGTVIAVLGVLLTVVRGVQTVMALFAGGFQLLAGAAGKTQGGLKGFASFLGGPWGIAIGVATLALGLFMSSADETRGKVNSLKDAMLNAAEGAQKAGRAWVLNELESSGAARAASDLGLSVNSVVDAYMGLPGAMDRVKNQLMQNMSTDLEYQENYELLMEVLGQGPETYKQAEEAVKRKADADREGALMVNFATDALKIQKGVLEAIRVEQQRQQDVKLAATNSELAYRNTLQRTTDAIRENQTTLDINTQEGRDNLGVLAELAAAGARRVTDLQAQKASTDVVNAAIKQNEAAILALIQPFFNSADAARQYAEDVGLIPKAPTVTPVFNDAPARRKMGSFEIYLNDLIRPRTVTVDVDMQHIPGLIGTPVPENARGGPVAAGQWSWVGEEGPELVQFGRAGRVYSNQESMRMVGDVNALDSMTTSGGTGRSQSTAMMSAGARIPTTIIVQPQFTAKVYVGDKEITDLVKVELVEHDKQLARVINAGTGRRR